MAQPYVGEIRMFAGNFPPAGWMFCDGNPLPISENETLFQLIGTTYGGDGESTFNLPNLQSRIPVHMGSFGGQTFQLAESGGSESVTLTTQQIPVHTHPLLCAASGGIPNSNPKDGFWAATDQMQYSTAPGAAVMGNNPPLRSDIAGGSQPHENFQPYLCINFIISLFGLFPSQT
ncbi:MAG: phage tail protein [Acidobacteria bacterium]|nr:MAG: phage tail protein [Acidobacteriota bacterium]